MSNQDFTSPEEALAHFGVKGMKWGVIRDLNRGSTNTSTEKAIKTAEKAERKTESREVKAKKLDGISDTYQRRIDLIQSRPTRSAAAKRTQETQIRELKQAQSVVKADAAKVRNGQLTSTQKKVIVGASVAGGLLLAYGAYKFHDSGEIHQMIIKGKELINGTEHTWKTNSDLARKMSADDIFNNVVKPINPEYGKYGTKMNCRRCTFAYEMRRRGLDVKATLSNAATGQDNIGVFNATNKEQLPTSYLGKIVAFARESDSDGPKPLTELLTGASSSPWGANAIDIRRSLTVTASPFDSNYASKLAESKVSGMGQAKSILDSLAGQPDGARGELGVGWNFGGGHSVAWEIVGGKPVIFDNQSGEKFDTPENFAKFAKNVVNAGFTRLDNIELNDDFLQRWVTNNG